MNKDGLMVFPICAIFMGWLATVVFPGFHLGMYFLMGIIPIGWVITVLGGIVKLVDYVVDLGPIIGG